MARSGEDRLISGIMPAHAEVAFRKQSFYAATQAVATLTVGLATTYTGLCVSNPVGSNTDLVLIDCSVMQSIIQSVQPEAYAVATGYNASTNVTHTTPSSIYSGFVDNAPATNQSIAKVDTSATLPTAPVYTHFLTNTPSATTNAAGITVEFKGRLILGPGAYVVITAPGQASVAGVWASFSWFERPRS